MIDVDSGDDVEINDAPPDPDGGHYPCVVVSGCNRRIDTISALPSSRHTV